MKSLSFPADTVGWGVSPRGAGYLFGSDVVSNFNEGNGLDMICRYDVIQCFKINLVILTSLVIRKLILRIKSVTSSMEINETT